MLALDGVNLVKDLRMNDMDVVDTYTRLSTLEKQLDAFKCAKCPELNAHVRNKRNREKPSK